MDFKHMLYFCTIVEQGQISRAAKKLNMSQPPLSLRLKELEEEVGCPLILRAGGRWEVTREGQLLYNKAQQILSHLDGLVESVKNAAHDVRGQVRIGIGSHCLSTFQNVVPAVARLYPHISLRAIVADSPTIETLLQERSIEIAVLRLQLSSANCITHNLPSQHFVAVFSRMLPPPPPGDSVEFEDLVPHPLLFSRRWADAEGFRPIVAAFQARRLTPNIILDTQTPYLLFDLLYTTPAVAIMPHTEIPRAHADDFPVRRLNHYVIFQPVIAHLADSYLSPQATAVLELLKQENGVAETDPDGRQTGTRVSGTGNSIV